MKSPNRGRLVALLLVALFGVVGITPAFAFGGGGSSSSHSSGSSSRSGSSSGSSSGSRSSSSSRSGGSGYTVRGGSSSTGSSKTGTGSSTRGTSGRRTGYSSGGSSAARPIYGRQTYSTRPVHSSTVTRPTMSGTKVKVVALSKTYAPKAKAYISAYLAKRQAQRYSRSSYPYSYGGYYYHSRSFNRGCHCFLYNDPYDLYTPYGYYNGIAFVNGPPAQSLLPASSRPTSGSSTFASTMHTIAAILIVVVLALVVAVLCAIAYIALKRAKNTAPTNPFIPGV